MGLIKKNIRKVVTMVEDLEETIIGIENDVEFSLTRVMGEYTVTGRCLKTEVTAKGTFTQRQIKELTPMGIDVINMTTMAVMNQIIVDR
jgi:hypothetical protein